ncbi:hypothetical protein K525DRAFT_275419 [Schizophyllum commune Loenen D]|nr:hypothetical protein K525DRAFT_275419 [Schizophyllum commune Loenen D]
MALDEAKDDARLSNPSIAQGRRSPLRSGLLNPPSMTATTLCLDHCELGLGRYELWLGRYELGSGRSALESGRCTRKSGTSPRELLLLLTFTSPRELLLLLTFERGATSPPHHPCLVPSSLFSTSTLPSLSTIFPLFPFTRLPLSLRFPFPFDFPPLRLSPSYLRRPRPRSFDEDSTSTPSRRLRYFPSRRAVALLPFKGEVVFLGGRRRRATGGQVALLVTPLCSSLLVAPVARAVLLARVRKAIQTG